MPAKKKKDNNPFKIPSDFPNVRKFLNKLYEGALPQRMVGTLIQDGDGEHTAMLTRNRVYLLSSSYRMTRAEGVSGVMADRFNSGIWHAIAIMEIVLKRHIKEVREFTTWLKIEKDKFDTASELRQLTEQATKLGYSLVKKPERPV